jgi:hypothetical protein
MLQAEEERALKHIEQTRQRVKEMLKAKNDAVNEQRQQRKASSVNRRNVGHKQLHTTHI